MIGYLLCTGVGPLGEHGGAGGHTIGVPMDDDVHGRPARQESLHRWHRRAESLAPRHRPHPNGSEECLVIRGPEPLEPRSPSAEEALPPAREQLPLPRRRQQAHLEPQLRERGGSGTGTPFSAFSAPTASTVPVTPLPAAGLSGELPRQQGPGNGTGLNDTGLNGTAPNGAAADGVQPLDRIVGEPAPQQPPRPDRPADRAAAFRAATRRGRRPGQRPRSARS
jgi:hypothetical protein